MDFRVDYNELNSISEQLREQDEELVSLFTDIIRIFKDLDSGWSGPDCENFQTISINYVKGLQGITDELYYIAKFIKKAAGRYSDDDNNWKSSISKIGEDVYDDERY